MEKYLISEAFNKLKLTESTYQDKLKLAQDPGTSSDILSKLEFHDNPNIRQCIAENPNTPLEVLVNLAGDSSETVRDTAFDRVMDIIIDPTTTEDILDKLSSSKDFHFRNYVARQLKTSQETLRKLSQDRDMFVRMQVAYNENCPSDVLDKLADDDWRIRRAVAENPNTLVETLRRLINDEDEFVRREAQKRMIIQLDDSDIQYTDDDFEDWG